MRTKRPAAVVRACVRKAIADNYEANHARGSVAPLISFTCSEIVKEYGLDAGTYEYGVRRVPTAEQLVRNELHEQFKNLEVARLLGFNDFPLKRKREHVYVAADSPRAGASLIFWE